MRRFTTIVAAAGIGLSVGACGITNPFTGQPVTAADVQTAAVQACGFLPTASSVLAVISANPAIATAEAVAGIICGAVTAQATANLGAALRAGNASVTAVVNGVPVKITGTFVQSSRLHRLHR